jgi:hypothetical protein
VSVQQGSPKRSRLVTAHAPVAYLEVMGARVAAACLAVASFAGVGCSDSGKHHKSPPPRTTSATTSGDLAAVRVAVNGSGILVPFRPARIGRKSCAIQRGGPAVPAGTHLIRGSCETRVLRRAGFRVVVLRESWSARDFAGNGGRPFRPPDPRRRRLSTTWLLNVAPSGKVVGRRLRGDLPPQLVR